MATIAIEQKYGDLTTASYPSGYDASKLSLGSLMCQRTGVKAVDKWCGPLPVSVARPMETASGAVPGTFPSVISWSSTIDWVFLIDGAAATTNRRIILHTYNKSTDAFIWMGYITVMMVGTGNHTVTGFKMTYDLYTTGTAAVSGTAVTGTSTAWQTSRLAVGSRIGFGSSTPSSITTWYEISAIGGNTSITLATDAGTIGDGAYVIEDLRAVIQTTSSVANNGNLMVVKGLNPDIFRSSNVSPFSTLVNNGSVASAPSPSATATTHVSSGTFLWLTSAATHWLAVGQSVTLATWTWAGVNSGSVNGTWIVYAVTDATHYVLSITSGTCPSAGSNPTVVGTITSGGAITDGMRAGYWLSDAATSTNQTAIGIGVMPKDSWTQQYCWPANNTSAGTLMHLYKHNIRGALTLTLGKDTTTLALQTNDSNAITPWVNNPVRNNNCCYAVASHQTSFGSGIGCLYFTDATSVHRTKDVTTIAASDVAFVASDYCREMPPGVENIITPHSTAAWHNCIPPDLRIMTSAAHNMKAGDYVTLCEWTWQGPYPSAANGTWLVTSVSTSYIYVQPSPLPNSGDNATVIGTINVSAYLPSTLMHTLVYCSTIDSFVVLTNVSGSPFRSYVTKFHSDTKQMDRVFLSDIRQIDSLLGDYGNVSEVPPVPSYLNRAFTAGESNGMLYLVGTGTTTLTNLLYAMPIGADWGYASTSNQRVIGPEISTPNCNKFFRVYYNTNTTIGPKTTSNLNPVPEGLRVYCRSSGISGDSGSWTLIDDLGDLTGITAASSIQFMFEFKTIGLTSIPSRLLSITVIYDKATTDSHYAPSVAFSDPTTYKFAWFFHTAFNSTVPTLRVRLYDAVAGGSAIVDDTTSSPGGTFEKSTNNGVGWSSWTAADKSNETTFLRYTAASAAEGSLDYKTIRALLTTQ